MENNLTNWRERLGERLRSIVQEHPGDLWEFVAAFFSILWGCWMLNPKSQGMPAEVAIYQVLLNQAPEWVWGWLMVLVGLARWWSILAFGKDRTPNAIKARRITSAMMGVLYVWIQTMFFLGDLRMLGIFPMYQWFGALIAFWRAATPQRRAE